MKINRFIALGAIVLLIVGAMGIVSYRAFAQGGKPPVTAEANEANEADEANEASEANEANEVSETNEASEASETNDAGEANEVNEPNEANEASEANEVNEANESNEAAESNESAGLQGKATISAADAEAAALAANPGASVVKTELDEEQGTVVYNVELDNGLDVMVNAADGTILATETADAEDK